MWCLKWDLKEWVSVTWEKGPQQRKSITIKHTQTHTHACIASTTLKSLSK